MNSFSVRAEKSKPLLAIAALGISLLIAEIVLQYVFAIKPGVHTYSQWFTEVDTLTEIRGFYADGSGVYRADSLSAIYLKKNIAHYADGVELPGKDVELELYGLVWDYATFLNDSGIQNPFKKHIQSIMHNRHNRLDDFDSACLSFIQSPICEDGFHSPPFKCYTSAKKKILLLGDSFTWGHDTKNKTGSFANTLAAQGFVVYNTGISGADPAQYLAIAQKYIPLLKPDYVVVNFFMGNDVLYNKREVSPYHPFHYSTNAGKLSACPNGIYFKTAKEAYTFVKSHYTIPSDNLFNRLCALTAISTLGWKALNKLGLISHVPQSYTTYWQTVDSLKSKVPVCNNELLQIKSLCTQHKAAFMLVVIPEIRWNGLLLPSSVPHLFQGMAYTVSPVSTQHYQRANGHYNDEGHFVHAQHIHDRIAADTIHSTAF